MTDAKMALHLVFMNGFLKIHHFPFSFPVHEFSVNNGNSGGVVSSVFKTLQPSDQNL